MAEGMNMCVFSGNVTADAKVRDAKGKEVANYTVAVNGRADGDVTYVRCSHWSPGGVVKFLTKGKPVIVAGPIRMTTWEKDGETKSSIELSVRQLTLLPGGEKKPAFEEDEAALAPF